MCEQVIYLEGDSSKRWQGSGEVEQLEEGSQ